ncbi:unnamed protein product [Phytomonas sp. EM1]|nr:unnamed protein product [Phytomonas sp. EM1]|eukprot:CCW59545.1 unnamed protein product [Phytomonas sp. isolate EM1]
MTIRKYGVFVALSFLVLLIFSSSEAVADTDKFLVQRSREEQIQLWESKLIKLRQNELNDALTRLHRANADLEAAKKRQGFFYTSPELRATIRSLDEDVSKSLIEVKNIKDREKLMLSKLKPLYGVLSTQFVQEQKESIAHAISTVQKISYDNAWYSSLFRVGEAESLTDLILGFLLEWLMGYIILYPFAALYYALWVAPWSVYAYCSGFSGIVPALVAYLISVIIMFSPLFILIGGVYLIYNKHFRGISNLSRRARYRNLFHED